MTNSYYVSDVKYIYTSLCRYDSYNEKEKFSWNEIKDVVDRLIVCFDSNRLKYELLAYDQYSHKCSKLNAKSLNHFSMFYFCILTKL